MTEEKRRNEPPAARPPGVPPARPRQPSSPLLKQAPTPLRVPGSANTGISPRPPNVAGIPDAADSSPARTSAQETSPGMPQIAVEAKLADFTAWRRDAERRLARLESEVVELRGALATATASAAVNGSAHRLDRSRDETSPILPEFKALAENPAVWSSVAAGLAPTVAAATVPAQAVATSPAISTQDASPNVIIAEDSRPVEAPPRVVSVATRAPRVQFDLQMKPGEYVDLPNALDGGRRKRLVGWLFIALILLGMAALVASSLASQR